MKRCLYPTMLALALLTVATPAQAAILSITSSPESGSNINLTTEGTADWMTIHWDASDNDVFKLTGTQFTSFTKPAGNMSLTAHNRDWADIDADQNVAETNRPDMWQTNTSVAGSQFSLSVAGIGNQQTLKLYLQSFDAAGQVEVTFNGGGAQTIDIDPGAAGIQEDRIITIAFAAGVGDTLGVTFIKTTEYASFDLIGWGAATLDIGTPIPEPASVALLTAGAGLLLTRRRATRVMMA